MREFTLHLKDGYFVAGVGGLDSKNMLTVIPKYDHDQAIAEKDARIALLEAKLVEETKGYCMEIEAHSITTDKLELAVKQRNESVFSIWRGIYRVELENEQAAARHVETLDAELSALTLKDKG